MKQITFQIDDTGKVLVFPQDLTGDMLPEDQKFNEADIKLVHECLYNIHHHPQFYSITSKDFKNKTPEETLADFNKLVGPVDSGEGKLLNEVVGEVPREKIQFKRVEENTGGDFQINTADGGTLDLKE